MERHFEQELTSLKTNIVKMGTLVDEQLEASCRALFDGDTETALRVVRRDVEVDAFDTAIDKQCQGIFALNQPVAADLRLLMSALNINTQLERIGDIAVNIAERVAALQAYLEFLRASQLTEMADIAKIMVRDGLDAFIQSDAELAGRVLASDDVVDSLNRSIFQRLVREMQADHARIAPAAHMLILSRHIERVADHATNIAEDVVFVVEARLVKHNASV